MTRYVLIDKKDSAAVGNFCAKNEHDAWIIAEHILRAMKELENKNNYTVEPY